MNRISTYCLVLVAMVLAVTGLSAAFAAPEERQTIDYENEDIRKVIRDVADRFELNVVIPETLQGRASVKLRDVTWPQVYHVLLTPVGYTFSPEDNIIKIVPLNYDALRPREQSSSLPEWIGQVIVSGAGLVFILPIAVLNILLFVGVLKMKPPIEAQFVSRFVWAMLVLFGGVVALLVYWLIHFAPLPSMKGERQA